MKNKVVENLVQFIQVAENLSFDDELILFRGQAFNGGLLPGIARGEPERDTTAIEQDVLRQLKLQGGSFISDSGETELDLLVLAQHYGLKTRLLDWTSSPLMALWFACTDQKEGDAYVYALSASGFQEKDVYEKSPFLTSKTIVFQPRLNNARITAQHGWFTLHKYAKKIGRFVALDNNRSISSCLFKFTIPAKKRLSIISSLQRVGINQRTIYPDLEGLCRSLNDRYKNRSMD